MGKERGARVVVLTEGASFPYGMAGTSRVKLYARGLQEADLSTRVLVVRGTEERPSVRNTAVMGVHEGIPFEYTSGRIVIPANWAGRRLDEIRGLAGAWRRLKRLRENGLEFALLYTNDLRFIKVFSRMCRRLGITVVLELCEWPLAKATYYGLHIRMARRFMSEGMPAVDAVLPISGYLEQQIEEYEYATGIEVPRLRVPILVDTSTFAPEPVAERGVPTILWCGSLDYTRITKSIVDAVVLLQREGGKAFRVRVLGGVGPDYQLRKFNAYVERTNTGKMIQVDGFLPEENLRRAYAEAAACLVLLQDDDISRSRFPTKLGEFTSMGRPVIASPLGELARYLADGETAFMTRDMSAGALAEAVNRVLESPDEAEAIGRRGRRLAEEVFDYRVQGRRVAAFLGSLQRRRAPKEEA